MARIRRARVARCEERSDMTTTLPLPPLCLTLTPPWPQAIAYAGKRIENRHASVAKGIGSYRGLIGLSQSKATNRDDIEDIVGTLFDAELWDNATIPPYDSYAPLAGKLWLVADLVDVIPPDLCEGDDWHVSGQWGLILGQVYEVEPVACMGGQGAWRPQWCFKCQKVVADSHGKVCKACKTTLAPASEAPALRVVREL